MVDGTELVCAMAVHCTCSTRNLFDQFTSQVHTIELVKQLSSRLYDSGSSFLGSALDALEDTKVPTFLLHAGTAVEHLVKAGLAELNPLLLSADRQKADHLVWLADEAKHNQPAPDGLRTIGLDRALEISRRRIDFARHADAIETLRKLRNGVVHIGHVEAEFDEASLRKILAAVVAIVEPFIADPASVFGKHRDLAEAHLADFESDAERDLAIRVEKATLRYDQKCGHLDSGVLEAVAIAVEEEYEQRSTGDELLAPCIVCSLPALLRGELFIEVEVDVDGGRDGPSYHAYPVGEYRAASMSCSTCGLQLDSMLIQTSGALENWVVPDDAVQAAFEQQQADDHEAFRAAYDG